MPIGSDFSISTTGDIRHVSGTTVYSVLDLHAWLQDLADDAAAAGNDLLDILAPNPSKLDGPRDAAVASRLNLLTSGAVAFNIDDDAAQYINFGSIKQDSANVQYSGLKTIGGIVAASPIYVVQNGNKLTKFWADGHVQILVKVKTAGSLIDSGNVTAFSRKWGQTYSHFDVNLAAGGETSAALATATDTNILLTEVQAAALSSKVTVTFGDTNQDLGNVEIHIYDVVCKADCSLSPQQCIYDGLNDQSDATFGFGTNKVPIGCTPTQSALFNSYYRVKQHSRIILAQGQSHTHSCYLAPMRVVNTEILTVLSKGSTSNPWLQIFGASNNIGLALNGSNQFRSIVNAQSDILLTAPLISSGVKVAWAYDGTGTTCFINGTQYTLTNGGNQTMSSLTSISIDGSANTALGFARIRAADLYTTRLTNDQLMLLTMPGNNTYLPRAVWDNYLSRPGNTEIPDCLYTRHADLLDV